ncbi:glyoxalase-like protein [Mesorhizobium sp. J18]|uniref:VOC family protein n=1 Tax=Mesorhizobium sp. J18 TaxID=935263 RepID=UPI00119A0680|nr:VOC family protein [Mesorhizobium sp. J18]TWG92477.1 glyoxalase-like protein [Mesorhizobium sp. J18]
MSHPVVGIDHCYLLVEDLDRSLAQFQKLGFTLSPRGLHSAAMGSANHTIMFPQDYFELLGMVAPTEENAGKRELLRRDGEGLYAIACRAGDVSEAGKKLGELGIGTNGLRSFERPVPLPGGGEGIAAFSVLQFDQKEVPVGMAFMCQHHTPETVWLPELLAHRNGAKGLAGAVAAPADPEQAARSYARLFAAGKVTEVEGGWQVSTGSAPLTFVSRQTMDQRYEGVDLSATPKNAFAVLQIAVDDLDKVRRVLDEENVPAFPTGLGIVVAPAYASGAGIEFIES